MLRIVASFAVLVAVVVATKDAPKISEEGQKLIMECAEKSNMDMDELKKFGESGSNQSNPTDKEIALMGCMTKHFMKTDGDVNCEAASQTMGITLEDCTAHQGEVKECIGGEELSDGDLGKKLFECMSKIKSKKQP